MTQTFRLLCTTQVSNQDWQAFLDTHIPRSYPLGSPSRARHPLSPTASVR